MNRDYALTLWRADLVRFGLEDRQLQTGKAVIAHHAGWLRRCHGLEHLAFLFQEIEAHADRIKDLPRLTYAAWFHDAIYKSWRKDNEARSAGWAQSALVEMGADAELAWRVHMLILATAIMPAAVTMPTMRCFWIWIARFWARPLNSMTAMSDRSGRSMSGRPEARSARDGWPL